MGYQDAPGGGGKLSLASVGFAGPGPETAFVWREGTLTVIDPELPYWSPMPVGVDRSGRVLATGLEGACGTAAAYVYCVKDFRPGARGTYFVRARSAAVLSRGGGEGSARRPGRSARAGS